MLGEFSRRNSDKKRLHFGLHCLSFYLPLWILPVNYDCLLFEDRRVHPRLSLNIDQVYHPGSKSESEMVQMICSSIRRQVISAVSTPHPLPWTRIRFMSDDKTVFKERNNWVRAIDSLFNEITSTRLIQFGSCQRISGHKKLRCVLCFWKKKMSFLEYIYSYLQFYCLTFFCSLPQ